MFALRGAFIVRMVPIADPVFRIVIWQPDNIVVIVGIVTVGVFALTNIVCDTGVTNVTGVVVYTVRPETTRAEFKIRGFEMDVCGSLTNGFGCNQIPALVPIVTYAVFEDIRIVLILD
jgi:hypothetical protein